MPLAFVPDDKTLIKEALTESVRASREGRAGGVLEYLSKNFTINGEPLEDRPGIKNFIRSNRPDVEIESLQPLIDNDTATVNSPITVKIGFASASYPVRIEQAAITLRKEHGTRWLVYPSPKWRIVEVKTPQTELGQFAQ